MASGRHYDLTRKWNNLSVEETPGVFRRLTEDEMKASEHIDFPQSPAANGRPVDKKPSASLPRPKSNRETSSIFKAFSWSKKSRPKLDQCEIREENDSQSENAVKRQASSLAPEESPKIKVKALKEGGLLKVSDIIKEVPDSDHCGSYTPSKPLASFSSSSRSQTSIKCQDEPEHTRAITDSELKYTRTSTDSELEHTRTNTDSELEHTRISTDFELERTRTRADSEPEHMETSTDSEPEPARTSMDSEPEVEPEIVNTLTTVHMGKPPSTGSNTSPVEHVGELDDTTTQSRQERIAEEVSISSGPANNRIQQQGMTKALCFEPVRNDGLDKRLLLASEVTEKGLTERVPELGPLPGVPSGKQVVHVAVTLDSGSYSPQFSSAGSKTCETSVEKAIFEEPTTQGEFGRHLIAEIRSNDESSSSAKKTELQFHRVSSSSSSLSASSLHDKLMNEVILIEETKGGVCNVIEDIGYKIAQSSLPLTESLTAEMKSADPTKENMSKSVTSFKEPATSNGAEAVLHLMKADSGVRSYVSWLSDDATFATETVPPPLEFTINQKETMMSREIEVDKSSAEALQQAEARPDSGQLTEIVPTSLKTKFRGMAIAVQEFPEKYKNSIDLSTPTTEALRDLDDAQKESVVNFEIRDDLSTEKSLQISISEQSERTDFPADPADMVLMDAEDDSARRQSPTKPNKPARASRNQDSTNTAQIGVFTNELNQLSGVVSQEKYSPKFSEQISSSTFPTAITESDVFSKQKTSATIFSTVITESDVSSQQKVSATLFSRAVTERNALSQQVSSTTFSTVITESDIFSQPKVSSAFSTSISKSDASSQQKNSASTFSTAITEPNVPSQQKVSAATFFTGITESDVSSQQKVSATFTTAITESDVSSQQKVSAITVATAIPESDVPLQQKVSATFTTAIIESDVSLQQKVSATTFSTTITESDVSSQQKVSATTFSTTITESDVSSQQKVSAAICSTESDVLLQQNISTKTLLKPDEFSQQKLFSSVTPMIINLDEKLDFQHLNESSVATTEDYSNKLKELSRQNISISQGAAFDGVSIGRQNIPVTQAEAIFGGLCTSRLGIPITQGAVNTETSSINKADDIENISSRIVGGKLEVSFQEISKSKQILEDEKTNADKNSNPAKDETEPEKNTNPAKNDMSPAEDKISPEKNASPEKNTSLENDETSLEKSTSREKDKICPMLDKDKTSCENDKTNLEKDKTSLEKDETSLEKDKASLEKDETSLEKDKASLQKDETSLEKDKANLEKDKTSPEKDVISKVFTQMSCNVDNIKSLDGSIDHKTDSYVMDRSVDKMVEHLVNEEYNCNEAKLESITRSSKKSPSYCNKTETKDNGKTESFNTSSEKERRDPPVFVSPPPPPTKPVRSFSAQSGQTEHFQKVAEEELAPVRPPKFLDRISDQSKSKCKMASSTLIEADDSKSPAVPPRLDKIKTNSFSKTSSSPYTSDRSRQSSFSSSGEEGVKTSRYYSTKEEMTVDGNKSRVDATNKNTKGKGISLTFVPYVDSDIYYTDHKPETGRKKVESDSSALNKMEDKQKRKKAASGKQRSKKENSSSSNDEENIKSSAVKAPPIPPREKINLEYNLKERKSIEKLVSSRSPQDKISKHVSECLDSHDPKGSIPQNSDYGKHDTNFNSSFTSPFVTSSVLPALETKSDIREISVYKNSSENLYNLSISKRSEILGSVDLARDTPTPNISKREAASVLSHSHIKCSRETDVTSPVGRATNSANKKSRPVSVHGTADTRIVVTPRRGDADGDTNHRHRRSSYGSNTSVTSPDDERDVSRSQSKSRLYKYWPFRRKKNRSKETDMTVSPSTPEMTPAVPLRQSTPKPAPATDGPSIDANMPKVSLTYALTGNYQHKQKSKESDTHSDSEYNEKKDKKGKHHSKSSSHALFNASNPSVGSTEHNKKPKLREKEKLRRLDKDQRSTTFDNENTDNEMTDDKVKDQKQYTQNIDLSSGSSNLSSSHVGLKTFSQEGTISEKSFTSSEPCKPQKFPAPKEELRLEATLSPPRLTTPLREQPLSPYLPLTRQESPMEINRRFDGEFQRVDEDITDAASLTSVRSKRPLVVVAMDLGTTHSGYAFSFTRDPGSVYVMSRWAGQEPGLLNHKTLSALLLTPDERFHSFGLAARNHYHNLLPIEACHWLYFERFKMTLHHCKELSRDTPVTALNGKQLPALTVFAHVLEFFATHALQQLSDQSGIEFRRRDVQWVVTVPAIWRDPAKQLMRQAAKMAGMFTDDDPSHMLIVLEPEAASIYCRRLRMHQLVPEVGSVRPLQSPRRSLNDLLNPAPAVTNLTVDGSQSSESLDSLGETTLESKVKGARYMVVDAGGGTVDITVHELRSTGQLVELHRATGGPFGSTGVDAEFEALLCSIFGHDFLEMYKRQFPVGWVNLMTDFESRKRTASPFKTTAFNIALPFTFISEFRKHKGEVEQAVKRNGDPDIEWSLQGMLRLAPPAMHRLFAPTLVSIRQAIGDVLNHPYTRDLRYLFLVGGFAESPMLQHDVRREFGHLLTVLIPNDVSLAVLRGAVLFGLDPRVVSVRCARQTYGVGILNRFDPTKHPEEKLVCRDGVKWCTDVFDTFVTINQPVALGTCVTRRYTPARAGQLVIVLNVYCTSLPSPMFVTDTGVRKCGTLSFDFHCGQPEEDEIMQEGEDVVHVSRSDKPREILTCMSFGDTEISVTAIDVTSGKEVHARVDFLSG